MDFKLAAQMERLRCARTALQADAFDLTPLLRFKRADIGSPDAWHFLRQMDGAALSELPPNTIAALQAALENTLELPAGNLSAEASPVDPQPSCNTPLMPEDLLADHLLTDVESQELPTLEDLRHTDVGHEAPPSLTEAPGDDGAAREADMRDLYAVLRIEQQLGLLDASSDEHRGYSLTEMLGPNHVANALAECEASLDQPAIPLADLITSPIGTPVHGAIASEHAAAPRAASHAVTEPIGVLYTPRSPFESIYLAEARIPHACNSAELAHAMSAYRDLGGQFQAIAQRLPTGFEPLAFEESGDILGQLMDALSLSWTTRQPLTVQVVDLFGHTSQGEVDPFESLGQLRHYILSHLTHHKCIPNDDQLDGLIIQQVLPHLGIRTEKSRKGIHFAALRAPILAFGRAFVRLADAPLRQQQPGFHHLREKPRRRGRLAVGMPALTAFGGKPKA